MGIIIIPLFLGAFIFYVKAVIQIIPLIQGKELSIQAILIGIAIPLALLAYTIFYWFKMGRVYAFYPHFVLPFILIYLPIGVLWIMKNLFLIPNSATINSLLIVWIVFAGLLGIFLFFYIFDLLKKIGIELHY